MSEIDYHELAKAQSEYPDNEADRIIATFPDDARDFWAKTAQLTPRGEAPGETRLAQAKTLEVRAKQRQADAAERDAAIAKHRAEEAATAKESNARKVLGGFSGPLTAWHLEWSAHIERGGGTLADFNREVAKGKAPVASNIRRVGIF